MFASKVDAKDKGLEVVREIDGGLETINIDLPAVLSADLRYVFISIPFHQEYFRSKALTHSLTLSHYFSKPSLVYLTHIL